MSTSTTVMCGTTTIGCYEMLGDKQMIWAFTRDHIAVIIIIRANRLNAFWLAFVNVDPDSSHDRQSKVVPDLVRVRDGQGWVDRRAHLSRRRGSGVRSQALLHVRARPGQSDWLKLCSTRQLKVVKSSLIRHLYQLQYHWLKHLSSIPRILLKPRSITCWPIL